MILIMQLLLVNTNLFNFFNIHNRILVKNHHSFNDSVTWHLRNCRMIGHDYTPATGAVAVFQLCMITTNIYE